MNAHTQYCQGNKSTGGKIVRFGCQEENNNSDVNKNRPLRHDLNFMSGRADAGREPTRHRARVGGAPVLPSRLS